MQPPRAVRTPRPCHRRRQSAPERAGAGPARAVCCAEKAGFVSATGQAAHSSVPHARHNEGEWWREAEKADGGERNCVLQAGLAEKKTKSLLIVHLNCLGLVLLSHKPAVGRARYPGAQPRRRPQEERGAEEQRVCRLSASVLVLHVKPQRKHEQRKDAREVAQRRESAQALLARESHPALRSSEAVRRATHCPRYVNLPGFSCWMRHANSGGTCGAEFSFRLCGHFSNALSAHQAAMPAEQAAPLRAVEFYCGVGGLHLSLLRARRVRA
jgi:hypothetical protein